MNDFDIDKTHCRANIDDLKVNDRIYIKQTIYSSPGFEYRHSMYEPHTITKITANRDMFEIDNKKSYDARSAAYDFLIKCNTIEQDDLYGRIFMQNREAINIINRTLPELSDTDLEKLTKMLIPIMEMINKKS